ERTCRMEDRGQGSWAERVRVERLSRGDGTALADLADRYAGFVFPLALATLADRHAAEDVTQEVFVSLWEHPERIQPGRGTLRGFLGTVTHRRAVDIIRREEARKRREERAGPGTVPPPDMTEAVIRTDTSGLVRQALERLPEAQRRGGGRAPFHVGRHR